MLCRLDSKKTMELLLVLHLISWGKKYWGERFGHTRNVSQLAYPKGQSVISGSRKIVDKRKHYFYDSWSKSTLSDTLYTAFIYSVFVQFLQISRSSVFSTTPSWGFTSDCTHPSTWTCAESDFMSRWRLSFKIHYCTWGIWYLNLALTHWQT